MKKQQKNRIEHFLHAALGKLASLLAPLIVSFKCPLFMVKVASFCATNPYTRLMRLHRPAPILLLLLPCLWALALKAQNWQQGLPMVIIFTLGAIIIRSAGCTVNDLLDRHLDAQVARTKDRPLANGELSAAQALKLLFALFALGALLLFFLPPAAILVACIATALMALYPLAKRYTNYPQVVLGITYNLGVLMAWFSVGGNFGVTIMALYVAAALWTVGYDTIYAFQDVEDDLRIGIKSMAINYSQYPSEYIWRIYQTSTILIAIIGLLCYLNWFFYLILAPAVYHLYWQTEHTNFNDPTHCSRTFNGNILYGILVLIAILLGRC